jgi:GxxExxY protein
MIYEKELCDKIIGAAIEVHKELGNGFLEKVYENALIKELELVDIKAKNQVSINVNYKGFTVGNYFADILVDNKVILELKVCDSIAPIHKAQLINYLKATNIKIGYIINFGSENKIEFKRLVY